ncbi:MAG: hypothetical protein A2W05_07765 [Candidatus Schekmanbacteria bacterium RBG_16_38_10]|uniref:Uncharacterized protein n=1 Tax=Candidatus Schekmanbacteria bacterium RBG_16_38_10 TaxID=1817879 RepID=A0A1F7S430_9BACT|nr:MAG: hypothetical protein A2W05_07765 [Candidatus Schekmanbacteria bacterium RBG_16_38_10]
MTLTDAQTQLANWLTASTKVAQGQSYSISGRAVTRADAEEIRKQIIYWDRQVKRLTKGGITIKGATPV